jgi:predicted dehydrogenase
MHHPGARGPSTAISRRRFVKSSAALAAVAMTGSTRAQVRAPVLSRLRVGVIGCGGRGTGAAVNALEASPDTVIVALADVFPDRLAGCRGALASLEGGLSERVHLSDDRCFIGFDAGDRLLATDIDLVILASPPHFRPAHLAAAVNRGVHVFMEKPVAVDPAGIRSVLASAEIARQRNLAIVAGTQRRHETSYLETMQRVREGAIGRIVSAQCYWNQGGLWMHPRRPEWTDMEWQLRNWLYFTWLSGDHIVEQHIHNLDVVNWALGAHPIRATGMGGRQVRTDPAYGHVFDHFAVEYEYPGGVIVTSYCRQIDGCASRVEEVFHGTEGTCSTSPGAGRIDGARPWRFSAANNEPYEQEHIDLIDSITAGQPLNEAAQVAESTLTAIMGRMSAYTGKSVTWEQALNSKLDLAPPRYEMGALPVAEVAVPGRTPLV